MLDAGCWILDAGNFFSYQLSAVSFQHKTFLFRLIAVG